MKLNPLEVKSPVTYFFFIGYILYFIERNVYPNKNFLIGLAVYAALTVAVAGYFFIKAFIYRRRDSGQASNLHALLQFIISAALLALVLWDIGI